MDSNDAVGESSAEGIDASGGRNGRQHFHLQQQQIRLPNNLHPQQASHRQLPQHQHQLNESVRNPRGDTGVGGTEVTGRNNIARQHLQHQLPLQISHHGEATGVRPWGGNPIPPAMRPGDHVVGGNGHPTTVEDFIHRCDIQAQMAANLAAQFQARWKSTGSRSTDHHQQGQDYKFQSEQAMKTAAHFHAISNIARTWTNDVPTSQKDRLDLLSRIVAMEAGMNPHNNDIMGTHAAADQDRGHYLQQDNFTRNSQLPSMGARVTSGELSQRAAANDHHYQQLMGKHQRQTSNPSQAQHPKMGVAASSMHEFDDMDLEPISMESLRQGRQPLHSSQLASAASAAPHVHAALPPPQRQGVTQSRSDVVNSLALRSRLGNHKEEPHGCIQPLAGEETRNSQVARAGSMPDSRAPTTRSAANSIAAHGKGDEKSVAEIPPKSDSQCGRLDQISPGSVAKTPIETNAFRGHGRKPAALPQADCHSEGSISGRKIKEGQPPVGKAEVDAGDRVRLGPVDPEAKRPSHSIPTQDGCNPQQAATSTPIPSKQLQSSTEKATIAGLKPEDELGPKLPKTDASVDVNRFKQKKSDVNDDVRDALNGSAALPQVPKRKKSIAKTKTQPVTVRRSTRKRISRDIESNRCGDVSNSNTTTVVPRQRTPKKKANAKRKRENTTTVVPRQIASKKKPNAKRKREHMSHEAGTSATDKEDQELPQADNVKRDHAMDGLSRFSVDDAAVKRTGEEPNADEVEKLSGEESPPSKLCKVMETSALDQTSYIYAPMGHLWLDKELTGSSEMNVDTFCPAGTMVGRRWVWDEGYFVDEHCNPHSREYPTPGNAGVGTSTNSCADPVPPSRTRRVGRNRIKSSIIEQLAAGGLDPHTQIACEDYEHGPSSRFRKDLDADTVQPFAVRVSPDVPFIVDLHAHLCTSEIIGLLGGV